MRNVFELACRRKDSRVAELLTRGEHVSNGTLISLTGDDLQETGAAFGKK